MTFILAAKVLTHMFLKAQEKEFLNGFVALEGDSSFPILQFVDDHLNMIDGCRDEARAVWNILVWFKAYSGIKVNTLKTEMYQVNKVMDKEFILSN